MDKSTLELITKNRVGMNALDRVLRDSGELLIACDKIGRERDLCEREQNIKTMKEKNKRLSESITYLAGVITTLKFNPQSPVVQ